MKMVKTLLLGSAAGLVAVSAGQAADLPVKAKPVEYVKVCSLYGAGFYYMPGTDICLKIGGYVRAETTYHSNGNFGAGPDSNEVFMRQTSEWAMRARAYITADAREQSAWGTIRAYVAVGVATTDTGATIVPAILGFNRAFIQWAGMTAGITQSFFDFYSAAAVGYRAYLPSSDTGDAGWWLWAYTAQLGNGLSASISAEQRRTSQIINITNVANAAGAITWGRCKPPWAGLPTAPLTLAAVIPRPFRALLTAMAASRCPISLAMSASIRPGAAPRSWPRRIKLMPYITTSAPSARHPAQSTQSAVIPATSGALSWPPACAGTSRISPRAITSRPRSTTRTAP